MDEGSHTAGALTGFTPNMKPADIAELDRRRGLGDMGAFNDPDLIVNKRPWLKPDGTHKALENKGSNMSIDAMQAFMEKGIPGQSQEAARRAQQRQSGRRERQVQQHYGVRSAGKSEDDEDEIEVEKFFDTAKALKLPEGGTNFGKPKPEKREGETEFERDIRHHMGHLDRHPGGRDQAVAIAADEAGVAKKGYSVDATEMDRKLEPLRKYGKGKNGDDAGPKVDKDKEEDAKDIADKLFGKNVMPAMAPTPPMSSPPAPMPVGSQMPGTMKAFSSRSISIPVPLTSYDPFGVERHARSIPLSQAAIGEGSRSSAAPGPVYKSCATHGITFRAEQGCHPCAVLKSQECPTCGAGMMKSFGGVLRCPRGH